MALSDVETGRPDPLPQFHFVVPVRHPSSVRDPDRQQAALAQLFASLAGQTDRRFLCHVAVNPEQVLPPLPAFARRVDVDLPPNRDLEAASSAEAVFQAIRMDKGQRVRAAVRSLRPDDYVMVVDDDDLVSDRLVAFVLERRAREGTEKVWLVDKGYGWVDGSNSVFEIDQFHRYCGTSLIVPLHRYKLVRMGGSGTEAAEREQISELGSHRLLVDDGVREGRAFGRVPFRGAIYRLGHNNATRDLRARAKGAKGGLVLHGFALRLRRRLGRLRQRLTGFDPDYLLGGVRVRRDRVRPLAELRSEFFGDAAD